MVFGTSRRLFISVIAILFLPLALKGGSQLLQLIQSRYGWIKYAGYAALALIGLAFVAFLGMLVTIGWRLIEDYTRWGRLRRSRVELSLTQVRDPSLRLSHRHLSAARDQALLGTRRHLRDPGC
jgi:hypothetical protein